jgi:coenzyme Q-binding protein COQ10
MPTHAEKKIVPYSEEQMFDLVIDVEAYPEFLPWCQQCKIISDDGRHIMANLVIGYKLFREWFASRVTYVRPNSIRVEYINGPLRYLSNTWDFSVTKDGGCLVDFYVDFEFKNPIFQKLMGVFFNEIVKRMVSAFEARAKDLYDPKPPIKPVKSNIRPSAERPKRKKEV